MADNPSRTATQLAVDRRHNEDAIVAEAALYGERFLSVVRLCMFAVWGISMFVGARIAMGRTQPDSIRGFVLAGYALISVVAIVNIRREWREVSSGKRKASVRDAIYWPLFFTVLDFTFTAMMHWRSAANGTYFPTGFVASSVFFMAFSLVRFSAFHVAFSTACAIIAFVVMDVFVIRRPVQPLELTFIIASYLGLGVLIGFTNRRIKEMFVDVRKRENLSRFLPRQVADRVMKNAGMLRPTQREVTILFTDIRDFTSMSEHMQPAEVLSFLDEYFGHMSQIVKGHDGIVNKFLGDGMLAVWGAPDTDDAHAEKALKAGLDMRKKLVEFNQQRAVRNLPAIRMGIGIHTGVVAAGMLGGADQHEYTVIGDAVNLASRIESLTKTLGVDLLVSESTRKQIKEPRFECARAGEEKVKGRAETVVVYTVTSAAAPAATAKA